MIKDYVILGGGTAGLLSALFLQRTFPMSNITLVRSTDIGIIGVGEGSTEHWRQMMIHLGIEASDVIKNTDATYKTGIRFTNWHGDGTEYWHALHDGYALDVATGTYPLMEHDIAAGEDALHSVFPLSLRSEHAPPWTDTVAQYHFDTNKLNKYFTQICEERGVRVVDDIVTDVTLDETGHVTTLVGEKETYKGGFFVDASGFKRLISTKLGAEWIDCSDKLPMNSAIAFPTGYKEDIPSHTEARALSSGWMWRIPTQQRFGNGYVFCDDFINEDQAWEEVQQQVDEPVEIGKKIKFGAGHVKEFWIKNCVSVGLAGMFVEPLEASSIGSTIQQLFRLGVALNGYGVGNTIQAQKYNKTMSEIAENIIDFIQVHYINQRRDSKFWRWCAENLKLTDFNREQLPQILKYGPSQANFADNPFIMFNFLNFTQVLWGLRLFDQEVFKKRWDEHYSWRQDFVEQCQVYPPMYPPVKHRQALEYVKQGFHGMGDI